MICLFVYVFYRTEKTLINQIVLACISRETFYSIKESVCSAIPLKEYFIFSLPEGLWIFCTTITSSFFFIEWKEKRYNLYLLPILIAVIMELLQLLRLINGRFDLMDLVFSIGFWMFALLLTREVSMERQPLFNQFDRKFVFCISTYGIVYLAHVVY